MESPTPPQTLQSFLDEFLVECPSCSKVARITVLVELKPQANLTCLACGHVSSKLIRQKRGLTILGAPIDPYFHLPLWLKADCCGERLWAYNRRHLAFLKEFVGAKLRDVGTTGHRNLGNKLPKWMLLAKNRDDVLRVIARLEAK